jgi:plastocyanin
MRLSVVQKELVGISAALVCLSATVGVLASEVVTVVQKDRQFQRDSVSVAAGDSIRFTNEDPFIHQLYVRSSDFSFSSEEQGKGTVLTVPFPVAGTFEVRCEIHPRMLLTVEVI